MPLYISLALLRVLKKGRYIIYIHFKAISVLMRSVKGPWRNRISSTVEKQSAQLPHFLFLFYRYLHYKWNALITGWIVNKTSLQILGCRKAVAGMLEQDFKVYLLIQPDCEWDSHQATASSTAGLSAFSAQVILSKYKQQSCSDIFSTPPQCREALQRQLKEHLLPTYIA